METTTLTGDTEAARTVDMTEVPMSAELVNSAELQAADLENTYLVPSVAASIVQDLTAFSDMELADKLPVIGINFTCKACGTVKDSLKDLMRHLSECQCQRLDAKGTTGKQPRGRPRKPPTTRQAQATDGLQPEGTAVKRPRGRPRKVPGEHPPKPSPSKLFQPQVFNCPRAHATRISTGAIKRRNFTQIIGIKAESDNSDDDCEPRSPTNEQDNDPEIGDFTAEVLEESPNDVPRAAEGVMSEIQGSQEGHVEHVGSTGDGQIATSSEQYTTEWHYVEVPSEKAQDRDDLQTAAATEIFKKSLTHLPKGTKVSLIPQTLLDIQSAEAKGQQTKPVVTIKAEDGQGSIVIPAPTKSGETKHVVIPNTLLLEALHNHQKPDRGQEHDDRGHKPEQTEHAQSSAPGEQVYGTAQDEQAPSPNQGSSGHVDASNNNAAESDDEENVATEEKPTRSVHQRLLLNTSGRLRPHRCPYCIVRYFATRPELDLHMDTHVYKDKGSGTTLQSLCKLRNNYACREPNCTFKVKKWSRMLQHLMSHSSIRERLKNARCVKNIFGKFVCPVCKKAFERKTNMFTHLDTVHQKRARTCEVCAATLRVDLATFTRHVEKCRNDVLQCDKCSYKTPISANMRNHQKVHSTKALKCQHCEKTFSTKQRIQVHMESHMKDRPRYPCSQCESQFLTRDARNKHISRSHKRHEKPFACTKCLYIAKIETDLTKHDKLVHNKRYKCQQEDCDFMTNSEPLHKIHAEYHRPECVHSCPVPNCYFRCATQSHLNDHCVKVHNTESKHKCPICYKMFKRKTHLLRHLVTHTDDKPYSCGECKMAFYSHSTYYRHRRKMGHDSEREGVSSVPQHILITYVQDGKEEVTLDYNIRTRRYGQPPDRLGTEQEPELDVGQAVESIVPTHSEVPVDGARQNEVVLVETSEAQFLQEIHMAELAPEPLPGTSMEVCEEVDPSAMTMLNHVVLPGQMDTDGLVDTSHVLENIVSLPEGTDQQYTYILSAPDAESVLTDSHFQVAPPEGSQLVPDADLVASADLRRELLDAGEVGDLVQGVVYREGGIAGTETVVKVTPPGGGQQYAILLVPSAGDEPEAALSMLQLQSSL